SGSPRDHRAALVLPSCVYPIWSSPSDDPSVASELVVPSGSSSFLTEHLPVPGCAAAAGSAESPKAPPVIPNADPHSAPTAKNAVARATSELFLLSLVCMVAPFIGRVRRCPVSAGPRSHATQCACPVIDRIAVRQACCHAVAFY